MDDIKFHEWSKWYYFPWDVIKTLENILSLCWWNENEKQIFVDLFKQEQKNIDNTNLYLFEKKLKEKINKEQIKFIFLGNTVFGSLHELFYNIEIVEKYRNDFLNSKEKQDLNKKYWLN